jgi:hypothetical protein
MDWGHASTSIHKSELNQVFNEISSSQNVQGTANFSMEVTRLYPNVPVYAMAFIFVMTVKSSSGSSFSFFSSGDPANDTGGTDNHGNQVPDKNNGSDIITV